MGQTGITIRTKFARVVFMINTQLNARLDSLEFIYKIKQLPSFHDVIISQNEPLPLTVDLLTCPVFVSLVAENQAQIEQDEQQLRMLFAHYVN